MFYVTKLQYIIGHHPFGESFKRQANILAGDYNLSELKDPNSETSVSLIMKMIESEPNKRPPAAAVLKHPIFWGKERILNFLQVIFSCVHYLRMHQ